MKLFEHQKSGIDFLIENKKAILADEMGLGKTRQAIIAARKSGKGALIICPASLKINWQREIKLVYPSDSSMIISSGDKAQNPWGVKWFIINYDIVGKMRVFIEMLITEGLIDTLILDEAHYIKGKSIRARQIVGGIVDGIEGKKKVEGLANQMKNVYCLTGTPLLNRPIEMFNLLKAIGSELGKSRSAFAFRYCGAYLKTIPRRWGPPIRFLDESGATNLDELRKKLKDCMLRRRKAEVLGLPPKIISINECPMESEWRVQYETAWERYIQFIEEHPEVFKDRNVDNIIQTRHLVEIQKLKQVCSQSKVKRIASEIRNAVEQEEKIIVFSQYTETIKQLSENLKEGIKTETGKIIEPPIKNVTLTGADDMEERQKAVDDFQQDTEVKVFIANIKAGGVGINLTKGSIVIFADMDWSPEIHEQAIGRAHRIGQTGTVNAYFYVCPDTMEEDIMAVLSDKKENINQILDGTKTRLKTKSNYDLFLRRMAERVGRG